jgi:hypothetical protein
MDFLSSGLFWMFFVLTGVFMFIFEVGYSGGRGFLTRSLSQFFMTIGGMALTIITILSFIFMWWQGGVAILVSSFIWMIITCIVGNSVRDFLLRRFRDH